MISCSDYSFKSILKNSTFAKNTQEYTQELSNFLISCSDYSFKSILNISTFTTNTQEYTSRKDVCPDTQQKQVQVTHNQHGTNKTPGAPDKSVNFLQSLMKYAIPAKLTMANTKPSQIREPAVLLWRIPENSVANTNTGILKAPTTTQINQ